MKTTQSPVDKLKDYYRDLQQADPGALRSIYADDILFRDPVHEIRGLVDLEDYFSALCADTPECRFEYLDELVSEESAYIKWNMHFRHPRLGKRLISLRGASHLKFSDRIDYHEDFYDMGAMVYENIPLLGSLIRSIRQRLSS